MTQCPHIRTSDEGTSYCELAEQTAADHSAPKGHDQEGAIAQMAQNAPDGLTEGKMWYPAFADWLEHELPEGTVIGDPLWWASKIANYLARYGSPAVAPVAWCRSDEFANAMNRGGSFKGWRDPGAGVSKCDMQLYAIPLPTTPQEPQP
jgi:hypothetical protein